MGWHTWTISYSNLTTRLVIENHCTRFDLRLFWSRHSTTFTHNKLCTIYFLSNGLGFESIRVFNWSPLICLELYKLNFLAMSLEIRPLPALYPPTSYILLKLIHLKGVQMPLVLAYHPWRLLRAEIESEAWDCSPIKHFFVWGGGITLPREIHGRLPTFWWNTYNY